MTSAAKLPPIDTSTRYMSLRDAVSLIGRSYPEWRDEDIDQLATERDNSTDQDAWDRAAQAEEQLERWILGKVVPAYDLNEYGAQRPIENRWLETPYFAICAITGRFLVFPDEWASIAVDGPKLQQKLRDLPATPRTPPARQIKFPEFERAARSYYEANPDQGGEKIPPAKVVEWISDKKLLKGSDWPPVSTRYRLISQARLAVRSPQYSHQVETSQMRENTPPEA